MPIEKTKQKWMREAIKYRKQAEASEKEAEHLARRIALIPAEHTTISISEYEELRGEFERISAEHSFINEEIALEKRALCQDKARILGAIEHHEGISRELRAQLDAARSKEAEARELYSRSLERLAEKKRAIKSLNLDFECYSNSNTTGTGSPSAHCEVASSVPLRTC